jgi:hypothetical protein
MVGGAVPPPSPCGAGDHHNQNRPNNADWRHTQPQTLESTASGLTLATVLIGGSGLFVLATLFFGTKGGYYDTDQYDGNGTAH